MNRSQLTLQILAELGDADEEALFRWRDRVFPAEGEAFSWAPLSQHIVMRNGDKAVAHLGFDRFRVLDESSEVEVIGIGGVVVRPEMQGHRLPAALFEALQETEILNAHASVHTLFCPARLVSYYARFDFRPYPDGVAVMQNGQSVSAQPMVLMLRGNPGLSGPLRVPSEPW